MERKPAGQLPSALAELTEAALSNTNALPAWQNTVRDWSQCSYDGDDE